MGGVGAWLSGGDWKDVLVGMGAGAVGGALTACGMPVLGGALGGGIMGAWSGGRVGYQRGGTEGAIIGVVGGGILGAGLGAVSGGIASFVGGAVSTRVYGTVFNRALAAGLSGQTTANAARYHSMVAGGYVGGASAGVFGNVSSTVALDVATGQPGHDGPTGPGIRARHSDRRPTERRGCCRRPVRIRGTLPRQPRERPWRRGAGGRFNGHSITNRRSAHRVKRHQPPRFRHQRHVRGLRCRSRGEEQAATVQQRSPSNLGFRASVRFNNGADLLLHRPGMDLTPVAGIGNLRPVPIPQQPLVVAMPVPFPQRRQRGEK